MESSTFYLRIHLLREDIIEVFKIIDTDSDGWITYEEYIAFIIKYLGTDKIDWNFDKKKEEPKIEEPKVEDKDKPHGFSDE